jgi:predicted transcriptional regulator
MKAQPPPHGSDGSIKRLSISVSSKEKEKLERIATDKRVSIAWVVRDAISHYLKWQEGSETQQKS